MHTKPSYPKRYRPDHPLAPPSGTIAVHRIILYDKIGPGTHQCRWCGKPLEWETGTKTKGNALLVDHIDGDRMNLAPDNLVPACNSCNTTRTRPQTIQPGEVTAIAGGVRQRGVERICVVCEKVFAIPKSQAKYRQGRFCSRTCRNRGVAQESGAGIQPGELFITQQEGARTKRVRAVEKPCEHCGRLFFVSLHRIKQGAGRFCSTSCAASHRERQKQS